MKKNVLIFGLISGTIITTMMLYMAALCNANPEFKSNDFLGYTFLVGAFAFIFVGVRNYRNNYLGGTISFGKAFKTGFYISVIASTMYVLVWLVDYYVFIPGYLDQYIAHVLYKAKLNGATPIELAETAKQMADFKELYKNPVFVILITYAEVLPIALLISLISAFILKRKPV
jgi:hypothetical protein